MKQSPTSIIPPDPGGSKRAPYRQVSTKLTDLVLLLSHNRKSESFFFSISIYKFSIQLQTQIFNERKIERREDQSSKKAKQEKEEQEKLKRPKSKDGRKLHDKDKLMELARVIGDTVVGGQGIETRTEDA